MVLRKLNIVSVKLLTAKRKYVYVLIFVLAAIISPPDVFTQIIIGIPLIVLYELSVVGMRVF